MFWSTCGYLIDREVLRTIVDKVVYEEDGWLKFKVAISHACTVLAVRLVMYAFNEKPCMRGGVAGDSGHRWTVRSPGMLRERIGYPVGILRHFHSQDALRTRGEMK